MSLRFIEPDFGLTNFSLSSASRTEFNIVDVGNFIRGSLQLTWSGATSSDAFATPATFSVLISNDRKNWEPLLDSLGNPVVISIGAASGHVFVRKMIVDWHQIKIDYAKGNSTGGTLNCKAVFKRGSEG